MTTNELLQALVTLSHEVGREDRQLAILGEGNTSATAGDGSATGSLVSLDASWAVIETVKRAEDGRGVIVRLYEHQRNRGGITLRAGFKVAEAYICNLLEEDDQALQVSSDSVNIDLTPYKIVSVRLIPAD